MTIRKMVLWLTCLAGSLLFISTIFAVNTLDNTKLKIGVLDIPKLMAKTGYANKALAKIRRKYAKRSKELEKERLVLQKEIKNYNKMSNKLTAEELKNWQDRIDFQQNELQQAQLELEEEIIDDQNAATQNIIANFSGTVEMVARRENFDLVLFNDVAPYSSSAKDITNEVIKLAVRKPKP